MEDKELFDILDESGIAENLLKGKEGKLHQDFATRVAEKAIYNLCYKTDLSNLAVVTRLVEEIKLNKFELFNRLKLAVQNGEIAFEELKLRNRLDVPDTSHVDCT